MSFYTRTKSGGVGFQTRGLSSIEGARSSEPPAEESASSAAEPLAAAEWPVADLRRYAVQEEFARGGLGRVRVAADRRLDRSIAVKELIDGERQSQARFIREALITARLQHPGIVPIYDVGRWPDGQPFYTMKMVSGQSLAAILRSHKSLEQRLAYLPNLISASDAVAYAHSQQVIHRDLKPSNILVGGFGETLVIDWGLAADLVNASPRTDEEMSPYRVAAASMTLAGAVMGTAQYMAPEQATGKTVDQRADVYALGAILYEILTGEPPYDGGSSQEVLEKLSQGGPPSIEEHEPSAPRELAAIARKAMARDAQQRYASAAQFSEELKRFQTGQLVGAHSYSAWTLIRRWLARHRGAVIVGAVSLVLLAALAVASFVRVVGERNQAERQRRLAMARNDQLRLMHARNVLDSDPTKVLAWLKSYLPTPDTRDEVRDLAAEAVSRGVARHILHHGGSLQAIAVSADGKLLVSSSADKRLSLWDVESGAHLRTLELSSKPSELAFAPDGGWIAAGGQDEVYLWNPATGESRALRGHRGSVSALTFSPDSRTLAAASEDQTVRLWDIASGASRILTGHRGLIHDVSFSSDGRLLITAGADKTVRLWSVESGHSRVFEGHTEPVIRAALSQDGKYLATAGRDALVLLWDLRSGKNVALRGHTGRISDLTFSPDGRLIASASDDKTLRLWTVSTWESKVLYGHQDRVITVRFSPDGATLASASSDGTARVWDVFTGQSFPLLGHRGKVSGVAFSPNGQTLATASYDQTVRLWNVSPTRMALRGHTSTVYEARFSPDGKRLATASNDGTVGLWDLVSQRHRALTGHTDSANQVAFSADGREIASGSRDGEIRIWDVGNGRGRVLAHEQGSIVRLDFALDGTQLASASEDGIVRLWDLRAGTAQLLHQHSGGLEAAALSKSSDLVVSGGKDRMLRVFNVRDQTRLALEGHQSAIHAVAISADSKEIASADDLTIRIWDVAARGSRVLKGHQSRIYAVAFSPDGSLLASAGADNTVRVWDLRSGRSQVFRGHEAPVRTVAFSPNGRALASAGEDRIIRLWDTRSGLLRLLRGHLSTVVSLAFSPDGERLASSSLDRSAMLWPLNLSANVPREEGEYGPWLNRTTTATLETHEGW